MSTNTTHGRDGLSGPANPLAQAGQAAETSRGSPEGRRRASPGKPVYRHLWAETARDRRTP